MASLGTGVGTGKRKRTLTPNPDDDVEQRTLSFIADAMHDAMQS